MHRPVRQFVQWLIVAAFFTLAATFALFGAAIHRAVSNWPLWLSALVLLVSLAFWYWVIRRDLRRFLWRRRARQGLCPACGYDLRASPGRCPECGAVSSPV